MYISELIELLGSETKETFENQKIKKIKMDSREIEKGDFFLVYGKGKNYIEEAERKGAIGIITEEPLVTSILTISVSSIQDALTKLAIYFREQFKGIVIAITGSNGKTTAKELMTFLLSFDRKVLSNIESENNFLGLTKTLLKLDNQYQYLVVELGMNHEGEIRTLSQLCKPDIGVITNIGTAHIGNLGSKERIRKAKLEIVEGNLEMDLFVNGLDSYLKDVYANKVYLEYEGLETIPPITTSLVGKVLEELGYEKEEIKRRMTSFINRKSRLEKIPLKDTILIDDAYNASLESILYGFEYLSRYPGKKLVILGSILELGEYSSKIHQEVYEKIKKDSSIFLITIGKEIECLGHHPHFYTLEELKEYLKTLTFSNYEVIYLKASHKIGLSKLVPFLKSL